MSLAAIASAPAQTLVARINEIETLFLNPAISFGPMHDTLADECEAILSRLHAMGIQA